MSKTLYPNSIRIGLIDPSIAQTWAQRILSDGTTVPSIKRGDTINHTTSQPIATGLFCQRIFGPCTDYTCACGQEKIRIGLNPNISAPVCPECHVEWTETAVRRQFLGSIDLISPVTHKWFSDSRNYIPTLLGMAPQTFRDLKECKVFFPFNLKKTLSPKKSYLSTREVDPSVPKKGACNFRAMHALQFLIDPKKALNPNFSQKRLPNIASLPSTGLASLAVQEPISQYGLPTKKERFFHNQNNVSTDSLYSKAQRKSLEFIGDSIDKNFYSLIATTQMLTNEVALLAKDLGNGPSTRKGTKDNEKENKTKNQISNNFLELVKKKENDKIFDSRAKHLFRETKKKHKTIDISPLKDASLYLRKKLAPLQYVFILAQNKNQKFREEFLTLADENKKIFFKSELQSKSLEDNHYGDTVLPNFKTSRVINRKSKAKNSKIRIEPLRLPKNGAYLFRDFTKYKLQNPRSISLFGKKKKTAELLVKHSKNWTKITKVTKIRKFQTISNYKIGLLSNSKVGLYRNLSPFTFKLLLPQKNGQTFAKKTFKEKGRILSYFQCCFLLRTTGTTVWYLKQKETLTNSVSNANFLRFNYYLNNKKKDVELGKGFWDKFNPFFTKSVSLRNFLSTRPLKKNIGRAKIVLKKKVYTKEHNLPIRPSYTQSEEFRGQFMKFLGNKSYIEDTDLPLFSYSLPRKINKTQKQQFAKSLTPSNTNVLSQEALKINFAKAKAIAKEQKIKDILSQTGGGGLQRYLELLNLSELVLILHSELSEIPGPLAKARMVRRVWLLTLNKFLANFSKALRNEKIEVLEKKLKDIKKEYNNIKKICNGFQKLKNAHKRRYKLAFQLSRTMSNPAGMTMSSVPVLPPGLRPIIDIPKIGPITADLNIRYRTLLFALRNLRELAYVDFRNTGAAQASVQEAVDDLLYTGGKTRRDKPSSKNPNLYKSLAMRLKGKHGRFRGNLLGKRVDYSGRSVIVVGPTLKLHQCGLPFEIAIKLFNPFLIRSLIHRGFCKNVYKAKQILLRKKFKPLIWTLCQDVMAEHLILLNRAPTLHRLGVQAFMPILISGRAILLHPLVCTGFNADFDGDQMGVHVPLFPQARAEAWKMMWSRNNFLLPSSGEPVLLPSQDMVLGCYYLTCSVEKTLQVKEKSSAKLSSPFIVLNPKTALNNYHKGIYGIQSILWVNPNKITSSNSKINLGRNIKKIPSLTEEIPRMICDGGTQPTLELRITSFGIMRLLHTGGMKSFAFQNSVLLPGRQSLKPPVFAIFIRTTIGRLIFNSILEEIETS